MANTYSAGGPRTTAVVIAIIILHLGFYWALKQGLVRAGMQVIQDFAIMELPPPPPPPEDLDEPPPPPPVDVPPPVVRPPLIELPAFEGPSEAARQVQITPARFKSRSDRIGAAIAACYPSASRRLSEEGRVVATITVGADGKAGAVTVTQSSGFPRLDAAVECVVRRLPFEPGKRDGQAVDSQVSVPIVFKLEE